jgi:TamB, inner membrane protein subunit of TAM complex
MRRRAARFFFVFFLGLMAMVLGVVSSMTLTPPGRALLARTVSSALDRLLIGQVKVGSISGSFIYDLTLQNLVVRDTTGALLVDLPRVRVTYRLPNLLAGEVLLSSVTLDQPTIQIIKLRNGRMNYEDVLGLRKGAGGGTSPLIDFYKVRVTGGTLRIAQPWKPDPALRTQAQRDSALEAERAKPGRVIEPGSDGLRRVIMLSDLNARFGRLRITTPDRLPFMVDIDSLATRVSDPAVRLTDAAGRVRLHGDSAIFSLSHGSLPDTRFSGGGALTWPHDTTLYDFQVTSSRVNLDDLHWVSPDFPAMTGRGVLAAKSETGARTAYDIRNLHLEHGDQRIDGSLVAVTDRRRGLGFRDMRVTLRDLDLDAARAYVDSLPFFGTLTGTVSGGGYLDAMDVTIDWAFADAKVPGQPVSRIAGSGVVGSTRDSGLTFTNFAVRRSDVDLRTVRRLAPAVIVQGRLAAAGTLNGPLHNVTFTGTATQQDGERPPSTATGAVSLDTRTDSLTLATDITFDPLSFEGIRRAFPTLKAQGELRGPFRSHGRLSRLAVDTDLRGDLGDVTAQGFLTVQPPHWGAEDLRLGFTRLNLAKLSPSQPSTALAGRLHATGTIDTLRAPEGDLELALSRSRIREWTLDSLFGRGGVHDSVIQVDTAYAEWQGARASGGGSLGWAAPHQGRMRFDLAADSLIGFDSLLSAVTGQARDTSAESMPLGGRAAGRVDLAGSLDSLHAVAEAELFGFEWLRARVPRMTGTLDWLGGHRPRLTARTDADTVHVGKWTFTGPAAAVTGFRDSLAWSGGTGLGGTSRVDATGQWFQGDDGPRLVLDSLLARLAIRSYRLEQPVTVVLADSAPSFTQARLRAVDGSSVLQASGRVPGTAAGDLDVQVLGLDLHDLYGLLQRDTLGVGGDAELELHLGGTAEAPTLRGRARMADGRFGDFQAPFIEGALTYENRRLDGTLDLWRTGENLMQVQAHLPLDLAFSGVKNRQLEGPLSVRAHTDSVSLGLLEAVTPAVSHVGGTLVADVQVEGTWARPRLAGKVDIRGGSMSLPGLGVRFGSVRGGATLDGDSVRFRDLVLTSGGGKLNVKGSVRLENLSRPILDLGFHADQFRAIDVRNFLTLVGTGDLQLKGPVFGATLTGSLLANSGVLYFADLVNKRIIDLEDPSIADLVDTTLIRRENLGAKFQNRFLDSLRIEDLRVEMGSDDWLRSGEANVQLEGRIRVSKVGATYNPTGTLNAPRGTYTLKIGPVARDFTVTRGQVTYTNDLNAGLDIEAQHVVRSVRGDDIPVIANISGTLFQPKLTLSSTIRPPISETDLISYLITGYPANEATLVGQGGALQTGLAYFSSALSSELERALIQDIGVPIDLIEIRPGVANTPTGGGTLTQLTAGWQIGNKTFLTFNAGFCPDFSQLSYKNLGAGLEFRFSREWKLQSSVEPTIQSCSTFFPAYRLSTSPYQIGLDILWEREF